MKEHDIPNGSKLYFGKSAKLKREIEYQASKLLIKYGFEEIVTPYFFDTKEQLNNTKAIHTKTQNNKSLSLRPDSTIEVLRLALNRINNSSKKWFYIQPIFSYPSNEEHQIGIECIDIQDISYILNILVELLSPHKIEYVLQVSNMNIVKLLINKYGIKKEFLSPINLEEILSINDTSWISSLAHIHNLDDLKDVSMYPEDIQQELIYLKKSVEDMCKNNISNDNIVIEPLYYDELKYYESIYFRAFNKNTLLAKGGIYKDSGVISSGFAIYTDHLLENIIQKG